MKLEELKKVLYRTDKVFIDEQIGEEREDTIILFKGYSHLIPKELECKEVLRVQPIGYTLFIDVK